MKTEILMQKKILKEITPSLEVKIPFRIAS